MRYGHSNVFVSEWLFEEKNWKQVVKNSEMSKKFPALPLEYLEVHSSDSIYFGYLKSVRHGIDEVRIGSQVLSPDYLAKNS